MASDADLKQRWRLAGMALQTSLSILRRDERLRDYRNLLFIVFVRLIVRNVFYVRLCILLVVARPFKSVN